MSRSRNIVPQIVLGSLLLLSSAWSAVAITLPQANDAGVRMELIASAPAIVTPIGIAVDAKERVLVLESHTHKPEKGYAGPKFDRVKALVDADGDGRFETNRIVANGIVQGMNLALGTNGDLFVCARTNVTKFTDGDGDGVFEQRTELLSLETSETYPHDCLLSVAVSVDGCLYVGRGNTGGQRWAMRARDGSTLRNFGDGGNVVRLRLDGSKFEEFATGFWNPFGLAFDAAGQLFCADNDPDSRGPNRIVHLVRGGDYGYRAQHGKSGLHPFQAWNGELPGTLPFVCGVGESPGTLVSCDFAPGLAKGVSLLVAIWGEERIDRVMLEPRGVSFVGRVEPLVRGDENFRPVALAAGPDGSVFVTDWGSRDYSNHGGGKLWRIKPARADGKKFAASPITNSQSLRTSAAAKAMNDLGNTDPFVRAVAIAALGRSEQRDELVKVLPSLKGVAKANAVVALRSASKVLDFRSQTTDVRRLLADPDEEVRFLAMKWAGEKGFTELAADVDAAAVRKPGSVRLSRAALEADQLLARANPSHPDHGKSGMTLKSTLPTEVLERVVFDESAAAEFRAQALVMLPAESARKHTDKLSAWAGKAGSPMQSAAIWSLGFAGGHDAAKILEAVIARENLDAESRADAVIARAMAAVHDVAFAGHWTNAGPTALRHAARFVSGKSREGEVATRPAATAGWQQAVATGGDARRGRRMFFSPQMGCAKCHVAEGRGAIVGPDLSAVGRSTSRARLLECIVEPSREVAIDFQGYEIETKSGETFTGLQAKPKPDGEVSMLGFDGRKIAVEAKDIASFRMLKTSLMPEGLAEAMSVEDFRDLLAYLENLK